MVAYYPIEWTIPTGLADCLYMLQLKSPSTGLIILLIEATKK